MTVLISSFVCFLCLSLGLPIGLEIDNRPALPAIDALRQCGQLILFHIPLTERPIDRGDVRQRLQSVHPTLAHRGFSSNHFLISAESGRRSTKAIAAIAGP